MALSVWIQDFFWVEKYSVILRIVWVSVNCKNHWWLDKNYSTCVTSFCSYLSRKIDSNFPRQKGYEHHGGWKWSTYIIVTASSFQANQVFLFSECRTYRNKSVLLCFLCTTLTQGQRNTLAHFWVRLLPTKPDKPSSVFLEWERGDFPEELILGRHTHAYLSSPKFSWLFRWKKWETLVNFFTK